MQHISFSHKYMDIWEFGCCHLLIVSVSLWHSRALRDTKIYSHRMIAITFCDSKPRLDSHFSRYVNPMTQVLSTVLIYLDRLTRFVKIIEFSRGWSSSCPGRCLELDRQRPREIVVCCLLTWKQLCWLIKLSLIFACNTNKLTYT